MGMLDCGWIDASPLKNMSNWDTAKKSISQNNNYDEAFGYFDDLLAIDPNNVIVLNNYSYYLSVLDRDLDKALIMIETGCWIIVGVSTETTGILYKFVKPINQYIRLMSILNTKIDAVII